MPALSSKCASGLALNLRLLHDTTAAPWHPIARRRRRRRRRQTTADLLAHSGPAHNRLGAPANLDLVLPPRGIGFLLLAPFVGGGAVAVRGDLGLDFHAAVEFELCDAAVAVRVAFFLDGVENTA